MDAKEEKMSFSKNVLLGLSTLFLIACSTQQQMITSNVEPSEELVALKSDVVKEPKEIISVKKKSDAIKRKRVEQSKVLRRAKVKEVNAKKPLEVARVCFDKKGVAHNCNHKIPKPYIPKEEKPYLE